MTRVRLWKDGELVHDQADPDLTLTLEQVVNYYQLFLGVEFFAQGDTLEVDTTSV